MSSYNKSAKTRPDQVPSSSSNKEVIEKAEDNEDDDNEIAEAITSATTTTRNRKMRFTANALLISTTAPYFRFCKMDKKGDNNLKAMYALIGPSCQRVETIPIKDEVTDLDWTLYADETGMMKGLPMNVNMNPLMDDHNIVYYACRGGPYGNLLLCPEKGALAWKPLHALFKAQDEKEVAEGEDPGDWLKMLEEAKRVYEEEK